MKKVFMGIVAVAVVGCLIGCNTVKGAGKDVENTGKNVQHVAEKND